MKKSRFTESQIIKAIKANENDKSVEFIGLWETLQNPDFKGIEFDTFRKETVNLKHGILIFKQYGTRALFQFSETI